MKDQILKCIEKGSVTFVELSREVDGFRGEFTWQYPNNWVLWSDMSEEAVLTMIQLKDEKLIDFTPCDAILYIMDGGGMNLPIVKSARNYKKLHWLPVVWYLKEARR